MTPSLFYREIPLTQGQSAIVDESDYEWLSQYKWRAYWNPTVRGFYAVRTVQITGEKPQTVWMHREILGLPKGDRRQGDHINHETLNNTRFNLRIATPSQNTQNRTMQSNNTSGFKGVSYRSCKRKWRATIKANGKHIHLGYRETKEECIELYREASVKYFGVFACNEAV